MATRAIIAIEEEGEQFTAVYLHFSGYPDGAGAVLAEHYTDAGRVRQLLALGNLIGLRPSLGEKHDAKDNSLARRQGWTTAYHRDRGDEWECVKPLEVVGRRCFEARLMEYWFCDWGYLFQDGRWLITHLASYRGRLPEAGITWEMLTDRLAANRQGRGETC